MAEEREMATEGLHVLLSVELDILREEAGELMWMFEAAAATARGLVLASISCVGKAIAIYLVLYAAVYLFFPRGWDNAFGWLLMGLIATDLSRYTFHVVRANISNRLLFLVRRSELAGKARDLKTRLAVLGTALAAAAADPILLSRSEELRAYIDGFPDIDGPWSQCLYNTMQVWLMVTAGLHFCFGFWLIYSVCYSFIVLGVQAVRSLYR